LFQYLPIHPPQGKANTDEGELLRIIGKFYYRCAEGDDYYFCRNALAFPDISKTIKNIDGKILYEILSHLESNNYNLAADYALRYIMLKNSNHSYIWNPNTNRLVSIATSKGRECLKLLDCKLSYTK
jgi:hypothetical protein